MKTILLLSLILVLSSCSWSSRMNNYEARFLDQDGTDYKIFNKRGALLTIEKSDGTKITADDRGLAQQPSFLSQAATILLLKKTE